LSEQLDAALDALMAEREAPPMAGKIAVLLQLAADLRDLPSADFRSRLRAQLTAVQQPRVDEVAFVRPGLRSLTPYVQVRDAGAFLAFMQGAFGAQEIRRVPDDAGMIRHAEVRIGDSVVEAAEASEQFAPAPTALHLYVPDADAVFAAALRAGAQPIYEPLDQPYGDREGGVRDPFGNSWYIATHQGDVAPLPTGLHSVTPTLHPERVDGVIEFLRQAFGAEETLRVAGPQGRVAHAKVRLGDSILEMGEASGPFQPMASALHLYVPDVDAAYLKAISAGARTMFEPSDQDYGDRVGGVTDPFGNSWYLATYIGGTQQTEPPQTKENPMPIEVKAGSGKYPPVSPYLCCKDAAGAVEFYKRAFGAIEVMRLAEPSGRIAHAEIKIGEGLIMLASEYPDMGVLSPETIGGSPVTIHVYVPDVDATMKQAVAAGAKQLRAPEDQFYGDRSGRLSDPFGHVWVISTHQHDMTAAEIEKRFADMMKQP